MEAMFNQLKEGTTQNSSMHLEKDKEIEFLQKEINCLMHEKADKENIIKTLTQENLKISNELRE